MPAGRGDTVAIDSGTGAIVIERAPDWALFDAASVTVTLKLDTAAVVGVPAITPAVDKLRPAGKLPDVRDQV
jgi:hypothetical protein